MLVRLGVVVRLGLEVSLSLAILALVGCSDRSTSKGRIPDSEPVPHALRLSMSQSHVADWWAAVERLGPGARESLLIGAEVTQLTRVPWEGALAAKSVRDRLAWGALLPSTDSVYWMDPLVGHEVDDQGEVDNDVDRGIWIYERATGGRSFVHVTTTFGIASATWADSTTAVLVGGGFEWEPGVKFPYLFPEAWVVSADSGRLTRYVGARISTNRNSAWRDTLAAIRGRTFPRLRWDE